MIEKDENPIEYDERMIPGPGKMIWRPPVDRDRQMAIKLMELAIDFLREREPVPYPPWPKPYHTMDAAPGPEEDKKPDAEIRKAEGLPDLGKERDWA